MKQLSVEQLAAIRALPLCGLPNRLRVVRQILEVDQVTLATAAGVMQPTVSLAESGGEIKLLTAQRIAAALGACVDDIFPIETAA